MKKQAQLKEFSPNDGQVVVAFTKVRLPFGWLGNMSPDPVDYGNKTWTTAEALFQALRFPEHHPAREWIWAQRSPMAAKMIAKKHRCERHVAPQSREDIELMRQVLRLKLEQNLTRSAFAGKWHKLVEMGDVLVIEDSSRRRSSSGLFWGAALVDPPGNRWCGENRLGELWMELLDEYKRLNGGE